MRAKLIRKKLDPERMAPLLEEASPLALLGDGEPAYQVLGWFTAAGKLKRVQAEYPNGWRLSFGLSDDNFAVRIKASIHMTMRRPS